MGLHLLRALHDFGPSFMTWCLCRDPYTGVKRVPVTCVFELRRESAPSSKLEASVLMILYAVACKSATCCSKSSRIEGVIPTDTYLRTNFSTLLGSRTFSNLALAYFFALGWSRGGGLRALFLELNVNREGHQQVCPYRIYDRAFLLTCYEHSITTIYILC